MECKFPIWDKGRKSGCNLCLSLYSPRSSDSPTHAPGLFPDWCLGAPGVKGGGPEALIPPPDKIINIINQSKLIVWYHYTNSALIRTLNHIPYPIFLWIYWQSAVTPLWLGIIPQHYSNLLGHWYCGMVVVLYRWQSTRHPLCWRSRSPRVGGWLLEYSCGNWEKTHTQCEENKLNQEPYCTLYLYIPASDCSLFQCVHTLFVPKHEQYEEMFRQSRSVSDSYLCASGSPAGPGSYPCWPWVQRGCHPSSTALSGPGTAPEEGWEELWLF